MIDTPWTETTIERMRVLLDARLSASQIATALGGGISRNAVIGKVSRMRLQLDGQPGPKSMRKPREKSERVAKPRKPTNRYATRWGAYSVETLPGKLPPTPVADLVPLNIKLTDIGSFQCRWIVTEQPALFCGHPALTGSWCPTHRAIVYTPRTAARRVLEAA